MTFSYVGEELGLNMRGSSSYGRFNFLRISKLALAYMGLGGAIVLGLIFLMVTVVLALSGKITLAIGTGALTYTLLYGCYALLRKNSALQKFSPYILH